MTITKLLNLNRSLVLRTSIFLIFSSFIAISYGLQLADLNSAKLQRLTTNFVETPMTYCLLGEPKASQSKSFGAQSYSVRVQARKPFSSSGLLIGHIAAQRVGDCYRANVRISPGFENSRIFFVAKLKSDAQLIFRAPEGATDWLKSRFAKSLRGLTADSEGLVAGLSIGDTSGLSPELLSDFKVLSLTHLTAVSGTNCAIILSLVWFLLARMRFGRFAVSRWPRLIVATFALLGYLAVVGPQPSVLRAATMVFAVLASKTVGRGTGALNALAIAASGLLIFDPWLMFDYGFLLSAAACVGILVVAPKFSARAQVRLPRAPRFIIVSISVSFAAQLMCFPVLLILQPGFSTYSIVANLLSEPLVLPITVLGILALVVSAVCPPIASFLSFVASLFAEPVVLLAHSMSGFPMATGFWPSGAEGIFLATLLAVAMTLMAVSTRRSIRFGGFVVISGVVALIVSLSTVGAIRSSLWAKSNWSIVSCDVGQGDATVIRSQNQIAVIDVGRDPKLIDSCLKTLGVTRINLLELTHFDLDHVAGLSGAIAGRHVDLALLTPFVDHRPGANDARDLLSSQNIRIQLAETAMTGRLGDFEWQVLSPHHGGLEAVDSNDGSITMLWRSDAFDLITLADLGQKGQMRLFDEAASFVDGQFRSVPLVMKVSHHGSADQDPGFIRLMHPVLSLISVGKGNSYGHPTTKTLNLLASIGSQIERTDQHGSIAVALKQGSFELGFQGEQGKAG